MPLGKYYSDYCDKQFHDTPFHRLSHIQGSQHQRVKALWYASFRQPNNQRQYQDSFPKGVCNRFLTTLSVTSFTNTPSPHFIGSQPVGGSSLPDDMVRDSMGLTWGNLPPSLRPTPEGGYSSLPFVDWG